MNILCSQCQYENREAARFCAECGTVLSIEPQPAPTGWPADLPPEGSADPAPGTLVAGRYYVLACTTGAAGQLLYAVEDRGICRVCGTHAIATDDEPYCSNCGAQLLQSSFPWPLCNLAEITAINGDPYVTWEGRTFAVLADVALDSVKDTTFESTILEDAASEDAKLECAHCLLVGQRSDIGAVRRGRANEDSLFALTAAAASGAQAGLTLGLYLVADGMGGHMDGEIASRTACEVIVGSLLAVLGLPTLEGYSADAIQEQIDDAFQAANHQICTTAAATGSNMGTTAVLALVVAGRAYMANVGDSRAYLWRTGELHRLTEDHSHVYTLFKNGLIEEDAIYTHPRRNEIFRSLGAAPAVEVDRWNLDLAPGDMLLLCSDGLWEMLRSDGIVDVLHLNLGDPQVICDELVRRANLAGGDDNISVIVVRTV